MSCKCELCSSTLRRTHGDHHYVESGLTFVTLENCRMFLCDNCGSSMVELPNADTLSIAIAEHLVRQVGRLDGDSIRFVRKSMGMTADEFALLLGTTRVEVSRWENNRVAMSGLTELRLRLEVVDKLLPPSGNTDAVKKEIITCMTRQYSPSVPLQNIKLSADAHYSNTFDVPSPVQSQTNTRTVLSK